MARKIKARERREITPGELYKEITLESEDFGAGEGKLEKRDVPSFVKFCKSMHKRFPSMGKGGKFSSETQEAVDFLGWDLKPEEFAATSKATLALGIVVGVLLTVVIWLSPLKGFFVGLAGAEAFAVIYMFVPFLILALLVVTYVQSYPISAANDEKTRALTYVPEMIGYMIMSMKLVPNLEKAVEFSAEHGTGKIAEDFKRIIWDTQIGVHSTLSEALDELAYKWGTFSEEFKHALMMIRASVLENTEAKRYQLLDKTMTTILDSIRDKMGKYARELSEPSVMLFYLGVLLPLILIIILPVGSAFSGAQMASAVNLLIIYNIIIPGITLVFARHVLKTRPPTKEAAVISDDYPGLPPKYKAKFGNSLVDLRLIVLVILVVGLGTSWGLSTQGIPPKIMIEEGTSQVLAADKSVEEVLDKANKSPDYFEVEGAHYNELVARYGQEEGQQKFLAEQTAFFSDPENDTTPYNLALGLVLTISLCLFVLLHFTSVYKREAQIKIEKMEVEFKDSLYILASRLGENKPVEEALKYTRNFLPGFEISRKVFSKTVENIELLGMPLENAVFDRNYGSLKYIPSRIIRTGMRILVDSVNLGVNVAARTIISLSLQLSNSEKVNSELKIMISDTTSMMRTMSVFIAPIVLGVTTALQKVVMLTLNAIQQSSTSSTLGSLGGSGSAAGLPGGASVGGLTSSISVFQIDASTQAAMATPLEFLIIVALYVLELVVIMVYFSSKIEEDNDLVFRMNLARSIPIAMTIFLVAVIASSSIVGNFMG